MAAHSGPDIADSGLVLALDAADINSFDKYENLALNSESINSWANNGSAISISANSQIAPDGTLTADVLSQTAATGASRWVSSTTRTYTAGVTYTLSIWLKKISGTGGQPSINLWVNGGTNQSVGTITTEWVRYSKSFTPVSTISSNTFTGLNVGWNENGGASDFTFAAWGFQLEVGSIATDYYRTTSTTKTRGSTIIDLSGNGNTGTLTNGPTFNSANGGSLVFDGTNDYITLSSPNSRWDWTPSGGGNNTLSFDMWVKSSDTGGHYFSKPWNGNGEYNYYLTSNGWHSNVNPQTHLLTFTNLATGNWEHICCIITPTQKAVYRNGVINASFTNHGITANTPQSGNANLPLAIMTVYPYGEGWSGLTGHAISGNVSSFKIYNRVLTATEIQQNFNATRRRFGI